MKVLIIGGVAGGASAAARLRRLDENAEIIIFERGEYISFANCGLPYYIGGEIKERSSLTLQTPASLRSRFNIDVRTNSEVTKINREEKTLSVRNLISGEEYTESYDKLIYSPGANPVNPGFIKSDRIFTLRNIPDMIKIKEYIDNHKPTTALIAGGGYIGVEMAENLHAAGIKLTIADRSENLIGSLDFDTAAELHRKVKDKGIELFLNCSVDDIAEEDDHLAVKLSHCTVKTDMLILAIGVRPESTLAKECGLETNEKGAVIVNEYMQTSDEDIYAVGDVIEVRNFVTDEKMHIPLAGPANKQGRIAADNIAGYKSTYKGTQGSSIIKVFDMTAASTGINEETAKRLGLNYDKTFVYSASHASYYPGGKNMSIKALWDKDTHKILGAQIVGYDGVDKRIDVIATAIRLGAKITDLAELELSYAPPFSSAKDPVNMLGFTAENVISGKLRQFFPEDVENLPRDGSVFLLDVRTPTEVKRGSIEGFVNIPLDELRENIHRLPKDKDIYVHCHSGLRSYIACRILMQNDLNAYNLAGGWRLYEIVQNERKVPEYICTECE
ncbi:MAG: CoA-disulfide reductase [Anaerofustis stercorihominis]|nr:CoA-disulfide reductase [Anaerofustis stercorihominis]